MTPDTARKLCEASLEYAADLLAFEKAHREYTAAVKKWIRETAEYILLLSEAVPLPEDKKGGDTCPSQT